MNVDQTSFTQRQEAFVLLVDSICAGALKDRTELSVNPLFVSNRYNISYNVKEFEQFTYLLSLCNRHPQQWLLSTVSNETSLMVYYTGPTGIFDVIAAFTIYGGENCKQLLGFTMAVYPDLYKTLEHAKQVPGNI